MELTGTVVSLLPLQTGQGKNGVWKKTGIYFRNPRAIPKESLLVVVG